MANYPPITHEKVQVVMTIENGKVIDTAKFAITNLSRRWTPFSGWQEAGYQDSGPRVEECRGTDSNTNS
jgi:hypothetical protein